MFSKLDTGNETHDDFKPKAKGVNEESSDVEALIKRDVSSHNVFLYMKGVPDAPNCGFSDLACKVLHAYGTWGHACSSEVSTWTAYL